MKRHLAASAAALLLTACLSACSSSSPAITNDKPKAPASHAVAASSQPAKPAAKKLPTTQARKKAAAVLEKEDQDFRTFLAKGEDVTGTPEFTVWYQKATVGLDMKQTAFDKADAYFTADNEPTKLLEQWRSNNGEANAKITQYAMDGTSPSAPDATTRKDAADARAALAKADKDAEKIASGS
ncbi:MULTISPECIES: hypothetical protein [unclassified Streptomyces]|uniref:hypothetical protein n=1 Tax=unclassified Streptomyces TaxID=2593676 RepID=UPI002E31F5BF|nr:MULTISPECIES: hypothetical protein [unclassified Streptomyces]